MENKEEHLTKLQEKQLEVINYYGATHQLKQLVEECGELIVAISKYRRAGQSLDIHSAPTKELNNLIEEFTDVENLIEQIKLRRKFVNDGVDTVKGFKVDRELERIERRK